MKELPTCGDNGGLNAIGEPCGRMDLDESGRCEFHREGVDTQALARERGALGGAAIAAKHRRPGVTAADLGELNTIADAQQWLKVIALAAATGRIDRHDGQTATRAVEVWVRANADKSTEHIDELERILNERESEIEQLRSEIARRDMRAG